MLVVWASHVIRAALPEPVGRHGPEAARRRARRIDGRGGRGSAPIHCARRNGPQRRGTTRQEHPRRTP